jgi:hypothetical protein
MSKRRYSKQTITLEDRLRTFAKLMREGRLDAPCWEKDAILAKAYKAEAAADARQVPGATNDAVRFFPW